MKKLFIWRAGEIGKRVFNHLSEEWNIAFVDTNKQLVNKDYQERKVISLLNLPALVGNGSN